MRRGRESKRLFALPVILLCGALLLRGQNPGASGSGSAGRRVAPAPAQKLPRCLSYQPAVVQLTGTLVTATYAGPPHYESLARGDHPETFLFLVLSRPVCIDADQRDPDINPQEKEIRRVQLIFTGIDDAGDPGIGRKAGKLVGKRVTVRGSLLGAQAPNQHTPVLLTVTALTRAG